MEYGLTLFGLNFLVGDLSQLNPFPAHYSLPLVALSYLFAFSGSFAGLTVSQQIIAARSLAEKVFWLILGAVTMGGAVWSMHFVGMIAHQLPFTVGYSVALTTASAVPSVGASLVVLWLLSRQQLTAVTVAIGGVVTGAGIGIMHYVGMAAIRSPAAMGYDPVLFALSVVVAVVLAIVALSAKTAIERYHAGFGAIWSNLIAAGIMGVAISGMHYTAMFAVTFYEGSPHAVFGRATIEADSLSWATINILFAFITVVFVGALARRNTLKSALLSAILDNSLDAILVTDARGTISMANPAAQRMFGASRKDLQGQSISTLVSDKITTNWESRSSQPGLVVGENRRLYAHRVGATFFPVEVGMVRMELGREILFAATVRDITAREELEQAQQQAMEEVSTALDQQRQLNDIQRQFVSMASHEIRTPLAIIDSTARRLGNLAQSDRLTGDDMLTRLNKIRSAVNRVTQLMESTLSAARLEEGKITVHLGSCDIQQVVSEVCARQQEIAEKHRIACNLTDLPATIRADGDALDQVFTNLLSNAVKYSPDSPDIEVTAQASADEVAISVRDYGLGIDQEDLDRIGERFFRAKTSTGIAGTGIGLNLVQTMIEEHGGSLEVESQKDRGSTFTVRLPVEGPNPSAAVSSQAA